MEQDSTVYPILKEEKENGWEFELSSGSSIYVPHWSPLASLKNLALLSKVFDANLLVEISKGDSLKSAIIAMTDSKEPDKIEIVFRAILEKTAVDGVKLSNENIIANAFANKLGLIVECFSAVVQTQYKDFFERGLAKEISQEA